VAACLSCFAATDSFAQSCQDNLDAAQASVVELAVSGTTTANVKRQFFGTGFVVHSDDVTKETYVFTAALRKWFFLVTAGS
jgi:hypothetical protein